MKEYIKDLSLKRYFLITIGLVSILFFASQSTINGISIDHSQFEVISGDVFNIEVVNDGRPDNNRGGSKFDPNNFDPSQLPEGVDPSQFTGDRLGLLGNLEVKNFILRPLLRPTPAEGTIYSINVVKLPSNSSMGTIKYEIPEQGTEYFDTNFVLGDPVISTDWDGWNTEINQIITDLNSLEAVKSAKLTEINNNNMYFETKITIEMDVTILPSDENRGSFESVELTQQLRYNKATGIREILKLDSNMESTERGNIVQTTFLKFTTSDPRVAPQPQNNSLFNYAIFAGLFFFVGFGALFVVQNKNQSINQDVELKKSAIRQKTYIQDLKDKLDLMESQKTKGSKKSPLTGDKVNQSITEENQHIKSKIKRRRR
ncbi:MAG: hypothetical protein ACXAC7_01870 [Candidatus Hodarchaeales archaeon]|jgi:hypothetical protein